MRVPTRGGRGGLLLGVVDVDVDIVEGVRSAGGKVEVEVLGEAEGRAVVVIHAEAGAVR